MSFNEVHQALLDFEAHPGRYPLALHQPRILFDHVYLILQLAVNRKASDPLIDAPLQARLTRAARFFVRVVLLRQGGDHYQLMGLTPRFEPANLRDHYRLLMRLTHPDFAVAGDAWPADAATRINRANDVLASPVLRREYELALQRSGQAAFSGHLASHQWRSVELPAPRPTFFRQLLRPRTWVTVASFTVVTVGALWVMAWLDTDRARLERQATPVQHRQELVAAPGLPSQTKVLPTPPERAPPSSAQGQEPVKTAVMAAPAAARVVERNALLMSSAGAVVRAVPISPTPPPGALPAPLAVRPQVPLAQTMPAAAPASTSVSNEHQAEAPVVARAAMPVAPPLPAAQISMAQVQPTLMNVVNALQSGRAEEAFQWVQGSERRADAANAFAQAYNQALTGNRVLRLGAVRFRSRQAAEQLVVDGVVQLHLQGQSQQTTTKDFQLRAHFSPGDGGPVLMQLVASGGE